MAFFALFQPVLDALRSRLTLQKQSPTLLPLDGSLAADPTPPSAVPGSQEINEFTWYLIAPKEIEERQFTLSRSIQGEGGPSQKRTINAFTTSFELASSGVSEFWERCVAPDGKVYFSHKDRNGSTCPFSSRCSCRNLTILTNNNMTQQNQRISVECAITELLDTVLGETMKDEIPMSAELVLELSCGKKPPRCGYYFAHTWSIERPHRLVFWAHDKPVDTIFEDWKQPVLSDAQLAILLETQYWIHVQLFPVHRSVPPALKHELKAYLLTAYSDVLTSKSPTSHLNASQIDSFLKVVESVSDSDRSGQSMWALARPMYLLKYKMFENYYGEYCARLNGEQSIFSDAAPDPLRSWLFRAVSATLFWIPEQCALKLQKVWVDGILLTSRWNDFLLEKRGEWEKTITPATVLLSVNVGFLAIQSIDTDPDHGNHSRNWAQIASYCSTLLCLGSYMAGHVLSLQHSKESRDGDPTPMDLDYIVRTDGYKIDRLAVVYSLPSALFVWSMVAFLVGMCWVIFYDSDIHTRAIVAIVLGLILVIVLIVMVMEGAANATSGTVRHRICSVLVRFLGIEGK